MKWVIRYKEWNKVFILYEYIREVKILMSTLNINT